MPARTKDRKEPKRAAKLSTDEIADRVSELIRTEAPMLRVEKHWGHPWFVGTDMVCAVGAFAQHVGVEFWRGSTVPDPDHLLEGSGKNLRHVKVRSLDEASSPRLVRLLRNAVALDRKEPKRVR
ncbi:MAG: DUF1801 domain-containing protein [Thermoplasmata archaeon]|nr:DUF1801 domain-containing protein [Thermoplasmata archaeon]